MYEMKIVFCNMKNIRNRKEGCGRENEEKISKVVMDAIYLKCTH